MSTKKRTILLDAHHLRWALRAALAAASKNDVTPILTAVSWQIRGKHIHLVATDRYRVHEILLPKPRGIADGEFLMHRSQVEWILANSHRPARHYPEQSIRITWTTDDGPGRITEDVLASIEPDAPVFTYTAPSVRGKFPPVERLFVGIEDAEDRLDVVGLDPHLIASLADLVPSRGEPLVFKMPKRNDEKPGPVLVQNAQGTARAIVQPVISLRSEVWQGALAEEIHVETQETAA